MNWRGFIVFLNFSANEGCQFELQVVTSCVSVSVRAMCLALCEPCLGSSCRRYFIPGICSPALVMAASGSRHEWEADPVHPWEVDPLPFLSQGAHDPLLPLCSDDESDDEDFPDVEVAGEELAAALVGLYLAGKLTAKSLCNLAWWAKHAGAKGRVAELAMRPSSPTGHFQRHLDSVLSFNDSEGHLLRIPIPGHSKFDASRTTSQVPVLPPHEALHREIEEDPSMTMLLASVLERRQLPEAYYQHTVVASPGAPVFPLGIFIDGVKFQKHDGIICFYVFNLLSGVRHLCAVLRKSSVCKCGCKGWCSYYPVLRFLHWSLEAMAAGVFPSCGPFGEDLLQTERAATAGRLMVCRFAALQIKGDWAEFALTLGFPTWSHARYPCLFCQCTAESMHLHHGSNPLQLPWPENNADTYDRACSACEQRRWLNAVDHARLKGLLAYDKRRQGSRGRALIQDVPSLHLWKGDRLEPCANLPDVGAFEELATFPVEIVWWRPAAETSARHRNPLLSASIGVSLRTIVVDLLHTMHLGVLHRYVRSALWHMIDAGVWRVPQEAASDAEARLTLTTLQMRAELLAWYRERDRRFPDEGLTPVQDWTPAMIGSAGSAALKTKAQETKGLLYWVVDLLARNVDTVPACGAWRAAGEALVRFFAVLEGNPARLPVRAVQDRADKKSVCAD